MSSLRRLRRALAGCAALLCALSSAASAAAPDAVRAGFVSDASGNLILLIAAREGFFRAENLQVELLPFDSAVNEVALLNSGDLDVGEGGFSATLCESFQHGAQLRVVADASSDPPGYGYQPLVVRSDLVASGRYKEPRDLRGMTFALSAPGASSWALADRILRRGGLTLRDVKTLSMSYKSQVSALSTHAADAALLPEPLAAEAVLSGAGVRALGNDVVAPNRHGAILMYSGAFIRDRRAVGVRFMRAYVKAARLYNDALANGKLTGPHAADLITILSDVTGVKDPAVIRAMTPFGVDPDGRVSVESLRSDANFFLSQGWIHMKPRPERLVDASFTHAVVRELGPYRK